MDIDENYLRAGTAMGCRASCSQKGVRMTSADEVYGSIMCDGALKCYGAIA